MRKTLVVVAVLALVAVLGVTAVLASGPKEPAVAVPAVEAAQVVPQANVPAPVVLVQDPVEPTTPQDAPVYGPGMGMMRGQMNGVGAGPVWGNGTALDIIAAELGLTADELLAELQGGATIADLAAQAGVTVEDLVSALTEAHAAALQAAVDAGTITADDAALMQEQMVARWTQRLESDNFFGFGGRGRGFGNGMGQHLNPDCPLNNGDGTFVPGQGMGGMRGGRGMGMGMGQSRGAGGTGFGGSNG